MPHRLMLIVSKLSYRTDDFVAAAERLGLELVLASDRCHVLAEDWPEGAIPVEFHKTAQAVATLVREGRERGVAGVLGTDDLTAVLAARVAAELGVPHNSAAATERARNKRLQREALRDAGVPVPAFFAAKVGDDAYELSTRAPFPCVLKPTALSASRGVIRADDWRAFVHAFERISALLRSSDVKARRDAAMDELLVEEFIPGMEYALEGLLERGHLRVLALFDKPDPLDGPYFEETLYITPSRLPAERQAAIEATVAKACAALGLTEGPIHAEVRVNDRGVFVLEVAARTIGGLCARTLRFGTGISLEELVLAHATSQAVPAAPRERSAAGVMMIPVPKKGIFRALHGVEGARAVPGIEDVVITTEIGSCLMKLPEAAGYFGFMFARAGTPDEVEAALREAFGKLRFEIDPLLPIAANPDAVKPQEFVCH